MPVICYQNKRFHGDSLALILKANEIIEAYKEQGFDLTLRQLYYQFVARGFIANRQSEYSRLGAIVNDARLAGLIDWTCIVDRTRNVRSLAHWDKPADIVAASAAQFRFDKWASQPQRVECWIEKDALVGVIAGVCERWDVPYFSCRGYTSQSEMWSASQRIVKHAEAGQPTHIIHLGDHDPSGIDMSRDIDDRLQMFVEHETLDAPRIHRIALNMDQIKKYNPPPNPAKLTDSRAKGYIAKFGDDSWELDALEPSLLDRLIEKQILALLDKASWKAAVAKEAEARKVLRSVSDNWAKVQDFVADDAGKDT